MISITSFWYRAIHGLGQSVQEGSDNQERLYTGRESERVPIPWRPVLQERAGGGATGRQPFHGRLVHRWI